MHYLYSFVCRSIRKPIYNLLNLILYNIRVCDIIAKCLILTLTMDSSLHYFLCRIDTTMTEVLIFVIFYSFTAAAV